MPSHRSAFGPTRGDRVFTRRRMPHPSGDTGVADPSVPCLFAVEHGGTLVRITDDWDGHVLIEKLYAGLREARQARDKLSPLRKAGPLRET